MPWSSLFRRSQSPHILFLPTIPLKTFGVPDSPTSLEDLSSNSPSPPHSTVPRVPSPSSPHGRRQLPASSEPRAGFVCYDGARSSFFCGSCKVGVSAPSSTFPRDSFIELRRAALSPMLVPLRPPSNRAANAAGRLRDVRFSAPPPSVGILIISFFNTTFSPNAPNGGRVSSSRQDFY